MTWKSIRRWIYRGGAFGALAILGSPVLAQAPGEKDPKKIYTNRPTFNLPVRVDERHREYLRELCLFAKVGGQGDWQKQDAVPPAAQHFPYRVQQDGEYWFGVAMIDRVGKMTPDVGQLQPSLKVVVDTRPPVLEIRPWNGPDGEPCIKCIVQDSNADLASIRLVAMIPGGGEKNLDPLPGPAGVFRVANPELWNFTLRMSAGDHCGNVTERNFQLREVMPAPANLAANLPPTPMPHTITTQKIDPARIDSPAAPPNRLDLVSPPPLVSAPPKTDFLPSPIGQPETSPILPSGGIAQASTIKPIVPTEVIPSDIKPAAGNRQIIKTTRPQIEYRIDQVGASGVGKVEVFLTTDQGTTWQRHKEDIDRRSPIELDLPGDGEFGLKVVVTNGNGFGGTPPQAGEKPQFSLEVDMQSPLVKLLGTDQAPGGMLDIRWTATDRNLGAEPVSLFYRTTSSGPWVSIVRNLKNDGLFRWSFPRELGSQVYLKIEVADLAGNVSKIETGNPVLVDTIEPRAQVIGVVDSNRAD